MRSRHRLYTAAPKTLAACRGAAVVALAVLAAAGCSGKGAEGSCATGAVCGGAPNGVWDSVQTCQYQTDAPSQTLNPNEQVMTPLAPTLTSSQLQPTTAGDWCSQLIYTPIDKVKAVNLYHDAPALVSGQVSFNDDFTYAVALSFSGYYVSHFAPYCIQKGGANPSCDVLGKDLTAYYLTNASKDAADNPIPDFTGGATPDGAVQDGIVCQAASDSGCDCGYNYKVVLTNKGTWSSSGTLMTQSSSPDSYLLNGKSAGSQGPSSAMVAAICRGDQDLTLTGYEGSQLFHVPGLRVLALRKHI